MKKNKTFPPISEIGDKYKEESFFKKQVSLKKEISLLQRNMLFKRIKKYNEFYGTHFHAIYKKQGESDSYLLEKIHGGIIAKVVRKMKSVFKKTGDIIDPTGQYEFNFT